MQIHQIRNATLIITYNKTRFLIDPWLMPKGYMAGFDVAVNANVRQPRVDLPLPIADIVDVDAVILTHFHPDHWDDLAVEALDKNISFFVQNEEDLHKIKAFGFNNVQIISEKGTVFCGTTLYKTYGQHGKREIIKPLCEQIHMPYDAMGVVFKAKQEKTLYIAGDTIWCEEVMTAIKQFSPEVIVVNACGATLLNGERIIMNDEDVKILSSFAPKSTLVVSHMDTVSHLTVTRNDIRKMKLNNVVVPEDNEIMEFQSFLKESITAKEETTLEFSFAGVTICV